MFALVPTVASASALTVPIIELDGVPAAVAGVGTRADGSVRPVA